MTESYKVGVIGAGNMGSGIAQKLAQEGIPVVLVDIEDAFVQKGLAIIPIAFYLKKGRVKVKLAVARGKKQYDKRATIKAREEKRRMQGVMKQYR